MLLPCATCLSGRTPSLLVGTAAGDVFKINMDFKEKYFAPKFIHPKSFVDVEFMHSASITKDAGNKKSMAMILAAADKRKSAKGRNPVYRELFHYHTAPIVLLECVGKVNPHILSIDAEGKVALWAYSPELFENQGWFRPLRTAVLDLRYLTLTKLKVSAIHPLPPQTPHQDLEPLLQLMRRRTERDEIVETFQPIRGVPGHPRKLEVQYQRHTAMNVPVSNSVDQLVYWSASNVTSSLLSSGVLDVKMTQDGEEVVLLMTYEGLLDDGSGNVNLALTELQRAESLRQQREARMSRTFNSTMSQPYSSFGESGDFSTMGYDDSLDEASLVDKAALDQLDIVTDSEGEDEGGGQLNNVESRHIADDFEFWMRDRDEQRASLKSLDIENAQKDLKKVVEPQNSLARDISTIIDHEKHKLYGSTVNPTWNNNFTEEQIGDEGEDGQSSSIHHTTMFAVVACLNLASWKFHTPLVQFTLQPHELVMGMHLGPVQSQTLTRGVFVQTTNQMRVFSLETGNEVISKHLPTVLSSLSKSKKQFKPLLGTLCPLQSMVAFGCAAQSMVVINKIDVLVPDDDDKSTDDKSSSGDLVGGEGISKSNLSLLSEKKEPHPTMPLSAVLGLKRHAHRLRRVVHDLYIPQTVLSANPSVDSDPWLIETISEILDDVFNGIWDIKKEHSRGKNAIAVLGEGAQLGVISPTLWPDPALLRAELARERGEPGSIGVMMAVYRGAGKFKRQKGAVENEDMISNDSSSDDSSSEGLSSEYETDDSSTSSEKSRISSSASSVDDEVVDQQEGHDSDSDGGEVVDVGESLVEDETNVGKDSFRYNDGSHDDDIVAQREEEEVPEQLEGDDKEGADISAHERRLSGSRRSDSPPISDITHDTVEGEGEGEDKGSHREDRSDEDVSVPQVDDNSVRTDDTNLGGELEKKEEHYSREDDKAGGEDEDARSNSNREKEDTADVHKTINGGIEDDKDSSRSLKLDQNLDSDIDANAPIADNNDICAEKEDVVKEEPTVQSNPKKSSRWGWGKKK